MLSPRAALLLAERRIDCRAVASDPALVSLDDLAVLEAALLEDRILVTNNVVHFEQLRRGREAESKAVPGLIYTSDSAFPRNRQFVARIADALDDALRRGLVASCGGVLWLQPPQEKDEIPGP
jgi:hypothetical protein